jgi:hypothetical protein
VLTLEPLVTLGTRDGPGALVSSPITVSRDSRGRYYVLQFRETSSILVFALGGEFLQAIGRRGQGPGEFEHILYFDVGSGDSLRVYDGGTRRRTVLSPTWEYVSSSRMDVDAFNAIELPTGETVINGVVNSPDRIGLPLHTVDEQGHLQRSFGSFDDVAIYRGDLQYLMWRRMAPAGVNGVWAAPPNRYVIELWDTNGERQRELLRDADWFKPYTERVPPTPDRPPPPALSSLHLDATGKLWVAIAVPALDWADRLGPAVETPYGKQYRASNPEAWDTVIEVIDPAGGRVVASQRVSPLVSGFIDDEHVYAYREDDEGVPFIDVWQLRLEIQ